MLLSAEVNISEVTMNGAQRSVGMTRSGFCAFGPDDAHKFCTREDCACDLPTCKCSKKRLKEKKNVVSKRASKA